MNTGSKIQKKMDDFRRLKLPNMKIMLHAKAPLRRKSATPAISPLCAVFLSLGEWAVE